MLKQRFFTAVVMAAVFLGLLFGLSATGFSLVILLLVMVAGWEWAGLANIKSKAGKAAYLGLLLATLATYGYFTGLGSAYDAEIGVQLSFSAIGLWAVIFLWIQGYPSSAIFWSPKPILALLGLILLAMTWIAVVTILHAEFGRWLLLLAIVIVVLADIGGYIAGKLFGKHKLAPIVSPGKTWEGFAGGMLLQLVLISGLFWLLPDVGIRDLAVLIIPVALYSVMGDLFESMLKRHAGVKDSSNLLPGHGGVLDRIDGIMSAMPLFLVLLSQTRTF